MPMLVMDRFLNNHDAPMPLLERVKLVITDGSMFRTCRIHDSAVKLRSVSISGTYLQPTAVLPWRNLTQLCSQTFVCVSDCLDVLAQTQNLRYGQFNITQSLDGLRPPIRLPHLTTLIVRGDLAIGPLLDCLVLPSLLDCELNFDIIRSNLDQALPPSVWPKTQIISFFSRSACPIAVLRVFEKDIPEGDLAALVKSMPNVPPQLIVEYDGRNLVTQGIRQLLVQERMDEADLDKMMALHIRSPVLYF
jgi:hypothetical protein